ncbi:type IV pilus assembly protein PilP [Natronospira proteinivora]|uniref:Type IV pilus assembly protein PilP n=1 Tax=Natronospira proteinivora TaxID=1807133 RepID=A0ABT1GCK4_9GAMM|nr:pilus assembly protein PilP [Natronospira proteinivora]MCP1728003.1 type IV pilus assembly protein PilP [Natronospira proteinivora]
MTAIPKRPLRPAHALLLACSALLLVACEQDMSDLEDYIDDVNARPGGEIDPIPQIETYEGFSYSVMGERSPFEPDARLRPETDVADGDGPTPDFDRRQEYLEQYPLDSLRMQGTLEMAGSLFAIIQDPEGTVHRVTIGNHIGQNHGEIVSINETRVTLKELVPDGGGGWNERESRISLSE